MKRVFHKSKNFDEAENWDIMQHLNLTAEQRQEIAMELKKRIYGDKPDVREAERMKNKSLGN